MFGEYPPLHRQVRASFVEVHLDKVFDLLGDHRRGSGFRCACTLRESGSGVIFAENAVEVLVRSVEELLAVVASGARARTTAATGVHAHSSRSHAILVLSIEHRWACVVKDEASCLEGGTWSFSFCEGVLIHFGEET